MFSSGLLAARWLNPLFARLPETGFPDEGIHLLAFGDFGSGNEQQRAVARQMAAFAGKLGAPLTAVLALGDNFYGNMTAARFGPHFEEMYPRMHFDCPFYACLGNHDYGPDYDGGQGREKSEIQLAYARDNPGGRWKLPHRWHAVELPDAEHPLVKIIFLDGNFFEGALTAAEKKEQERFLEAEVKRETRAPWRWMVTHYPMFSDGRYRDDYWVEECWGSTLRENGFSLYLSGHDHNLQHVEVEGYPGSFIVSGAGGANLHEVREARNGFSSRVLGFNHLHVTREAIHAQYIDTQGECLHSFRRTADGRVLLPEERMVEPVA